MADHRMLTEAYNAEEKSFTGMVPDTPLRKYAEGGITEQIQALQDMLSTTSGQFYRLVEAIQPILADEINVPADPIAKSDVKPVSGMRDELITIHSLLRNLRFDIARVIDRVDL